MKQKELAAFNHQTLDEMVEDAIKNKEEILTLDTISKLTINKKTSYELLDYIFDWYNYYRDKGFDDSLAKYQSLWKTIEEIKKAYLV